MTKVAINGLGRIGRATLKIVLENPDLELIAVNDLVPLENLVYLLKFDTVFGRYEKPLKYDGHRITIGEKSLLVYSSKNPEELPWAELGIQIVFECTGKFTGKTDLQKHLNAGAKSVILSAASKDDIETVIVGVNSLPADTKLISCASCTTNCIIPVLEIMDRRVGIQKAILTTVHAYTASQKIVDSPHKKSSRGRAGAQNIVPTSTGAATATSRVLPQYKEKFDGLALRVPVIDGSLADITFVTSRNTSVEELVEIFIDESKTERYKNIIAVTKDPLVSSDIIKDPHPSIIDLDLIKVVDKNLVKIMSWYDNEWAYASQMVREALIIGKTFH